MTVWQELVTADNFKQVIFLGFERVEYDLPSTHTQNSRLR